MDLSVINNTTFVQRQVHLHSLYDVININFKLINDSQLSQ